MLSWIWIPALYVLGFGLFAWLGGIPAAGDAIARWGHGPPSAAAARSRPARSRPLVVGLVQVLAADVVGDALLERLQALEQLLRRDRFLRLTAE